MASKKKATKKKANRKKAARKKYAKKVAKEIAVSKPKAGKVERGRGRPTKYKPEFPELVFKLALAGMTDADIAEALDVHEATLHEWKHEHPDFSESLQRGKKMADAEIAHALYLRARGFESREMKTEQVPDDSEDGAMKTVRQTETLKHYPPDTAAASLWLRNRMRDQWREEKTVNVERPLSEYTYQELQELANRLTAERDQMLGLDSD